MAGRFLFDVSGLLYWYAYFKNPSGIERVTEHLLGSRPIRNHAGIEFVARTLGSDVLYAVDRAVLDDLSDSVRRPLAIARLRGIFAASFRFASLGGLRKELWSFHLPYVIGGALRLETLVEAVFARRLPHPATPLKVVETTDANDAFFIPAISGVMTAMPNRSSRRARKQGCASCFWCMICSGSIIQTGDILDSEIVLSEDLDTWSRISTNGSVHPDSFKID